eukprot:196886-Hanusia_phi.AAC.1
MVRRRDNDKLQNYLNERCAQLGGDKITHEITVFDPLEVFGKGGALEESGAELKHPHHFFAPGKAPAGMDAMAKKIKEADCYVIVSAEYNHSIPPALVAMMGHFGGSNYACKPSAIIAYSAGPFAGARAAVALRPFLSELGCLPVSKMALFPSPNEYINEDGSAKDPEHRMLKQIPGVIHQLEWMAIAMKNQIAKYGPISS